MLIEIFKLFYSFLKLGFLSFGGGYTMLSMILTEMQHFSINPVQFADLNALDMVVPGSIAINAATFIGYKSQRLEGAIAATVGVSLPSFVLTAILMRFLTDYKKNTLFLDILTGIKPAAVGLILASAMTIGSELLSETAQSNTTTNHLNFDLNFGIIIFILTVVLSIRFKANPILLTVLAGIIGAFLLV